MYVFKIQLLFFCGKKIYFFSIVGNIALWSFVFPMSKRCSSDCTIFDSPVLYCFLLRPNIVECLTLDKIFPSKPLAFRATSYLSLSNQQHMVSARKYTNKPLLDCYCITLITIVKICFTIRKKNTSE